MISAPACDISLAITGSGGAGSITAGELLLKIAGNNGCFGMMRGSFGPQIRGGEAAALVRISHFPVECMNDGFDLLLALDWRNADRFAEEIKLRPDCLIIADPAQGEIPAAIRELKADIIEIPMKALAKEVPGGRPNMVALGILVHWLGFSSEKAGRLIDQVLLLPRVLLQIVQFIEVKAVEDELPRPVPCDALGEHVTPAVILGVSPRVTRLLATRIGQDRGKRP